MIFRRRNPILSVLVSIALSGHGLLAQPICETSRDDVDEFTGDHVIQITASHYSNGPKFDWIAINDDVCLRLDWTMDDGRSAVVFEGDTLMLKLENDMVVVLKSKETTVGKAKIGEDGVKRTHGTFCYVVEHEQFFMINHFWVQKLRINFREGHRDLETAHDPGWQMGLWRSSNCMRQALSLQPDPSFISSFGEHRSPIDQ